MKLEDVILRDTRANQPAATAVAVGTLYCVSDESNELERSNGTTWDGCAPLPGAGVTQSLAFGITIDGAGAVITTGVKGFIRVPRACTITKVTLLSIDAAVLSGSIVVDIWKDTYANYPPTVADTITAAAKPTLSSATKAEDATLTGWTTAIAAGSVLGFKVDSVTTLTKVLLQLEASIP